MAEPPYKRSRRDNDFERPRFDSRNPRDPRGGRPEPERGNDRNRSYRSRSPERPRERERERFDRGGGRRDEGRDRDTGRSDGRRDDARGPAHRNRNDRRDTDRDRERGQYGGGRGARDHDRSQRDRARDREDDTKARSRSPQRDRSRDREPAADITRPDIARVAEQDIPIRGASRTATPPVAFKVGRPDSRGASKDRDIHSPPHPHEAATDTGPSQKNKPKAADFISGDAMDVEDGGEDDIVVEDDAMAAMQAMMGFGGFGSTKQQKVLGNNLGGVRKEKKSEYRQYMNRVGGFNRPLSPSRE